jgi:hypothetical protein
VRKKGRTIGQLQGEKEIGGRDTKWGMGPSPGAWAARPRRCLTAIEEQAGGKQSLFQLFNKCPIIF